MTSPIICLNGQFLPFEEAKLPVTDRGFRFGDGVFETIRLQGGVPYQWELHMARLAAGLESLRIQTPGELAPLVKQLIAENRAEHGNIRIAVTRGNGSIGYRPEPREQVPNVVMEYHAPRPLPEKPCTLWVSTYTRTPLSALPGNHKLSHGISSTLALMEAEDAGCHEALQLTPNKIIACAAAANIFWIKGRHIFTPSLGTGCLTGTMRTAVLRVTEIPVHECEGELSTLENADAVFLTNSRLGIWPVELVQPLNLGFDPEHPIVAALKDEIHSDIAYYTQTNREFWSQP